MHKASRVLIEERCRWAELRPVVAPVRRIGGDPTQDCFSNAVANEYRDVLGSGVVQNEIISGWIVYPYHKESGSIEIIQHWWNYDPLARTHFDTTDFVKEVKGLAVDYVVDLDIKNIGVRWLDRIASNVGHDLMLFRDGRWAYTTSDVTEGVRIIDIPDLRIENVLIMR